MKATMDTGYQIYMYDSRFDKGFVDAGLHNWFPTLEEAEERRKSLEGTWGKQGVQYIIMQCSGRVL